MPQHRQGVSFDGTALLGGGLGLPVLHIVPLPY